MRDTSKATRFRVSTSEGEQINYVLRKHREFPFYETVVETGRRKGTIQAFHIDDIRKGMVRAR